MHDYKIRAKELLNQMTLKEKVGQLAQKIMGFNAYERSENNELRLTEEFKAYVLEFGGLGMLINYFRADPWSKRSYQTGGITADEREKAYNLLQSFVVENTRLGIPVLLDENAPHGRQALDSVMYPVSLNVGCSFNPYLFEKEAEQIGKEAKLSGVLVPNMSVFDVLMDPRWGRAEESFGEDPYLAACLSASAVRGVKKSGGSLCCKHLAGQGAAEGGQNAGVSNIGERELREIHLPVVESAVKAGCDFVMAAYNQIDGVLCHANSYLLNDILRDEMGFDGVVRSDGGAIEALTCLCPENYPKAAAIAVNSGVDVALGGISMTKLEEAIEKGYITEQTINQAVLRVLEQKFKLGLMDNPYIQEKGQSLAYLRSGEGQEIAYQMATESFVLLKNENVLPLKTKNVLLIGENLENIYFALGDYTPEQKNPTTVKEYFVSKNCKYIQGWTFLNGITVSDEALRQAVAEADVVLLGVGGSSARDFESEYEVTGAIKKAKNVYMDCGEGCDLAELKLVDSQIQILEKLSKLGKPIVSLIIGGRPYILNEVEKHSDAVIFCGYPGQEGARAIYDTLYGTVNNFGRLSFSVPKSCGQLPIHYNYKNVRSYVDMDRKPLYPFGYGLSYAKFAYSDFSVRFATLQELEAGKSIEISCTVTNQSDVAGKEVAQLYIHRAGGTIMHRIKELKGFEKVALQPGECKKVTFTLKKEDLVEWSTRKRYELFPMQLTVMLGSSSENILWTEKRDIEF